MPSDSIVNRRKLVSKTFRLPEQLVEELYRLSEEKEIPLTSLVTGILRKYVESDIFVEVVQPVRLSIASLNSLMNFMTPEQMERAGSEAGSKVLPSLLSHHNISPSLDSLLKYHVMPLGKYSGWFKAKYHENDKKITLNHTMGIKWSCWLKGHMGATIRAVLKIEPRIEVSENYVVFHLK